MRSSFGFVSSVLQSSLMLIDFYSPSAMLDLRRIVLED
jgi:hypothetical protein